MLQSRLNTELISFIEEETSEAGDSHKALIRVTNEERWLKILYRCLMAAKDETDFGLSFSKSYYLDENSSPTFCWAIMFWGDLESALETLVPILNKRVTAPKPPPQAVAAIPKAATQRIQRRRIVLDNGEAEVRSSIPLPHNLPKKFKSSDPRTGTGKGAGVMPLAEERASAPFGGK